MKVLGLLITIWGSFAIVSKYFDKIQINQRWDFIKENKKVRKQENTLSTKKATKKKRKFALDQEKKNKR